MPTSTSSLIHRLLALSALALGAIVPPHPAPGVIASLDQPPGGLACSEAADQAHVVFDFKSPRSDIKELSVFVNGEGLRDDAISEEWPRLTVLHGLRPGRNTVEVYATGADNKSEAHTLTVLVGEAPRHGDKDDIAIVDCVGRPDRAETAAKESSEPAGEVLGEADDAEDEVIEDVRPVVEDDVEYVDAPVYVYHPYPVFSFVSFFPAYYYPAPYYYSYYGYGRPYYGYGGYYHGGYRHDHGGGGYPHAGRYWSDDSRGYSTVTRSSEGESNPSPSKVSRSQR